MKKLISTSIVTMALCLIFSSCGDDDPVTPEPETKVETGTFEIFMDGSAYAEGSASEVGLLMDIEGNYVNVLSMNEGDFSFVVYSFPETVGGSIEMDSDNDPGLSIIGEKMYGTVSGTLTRVSETKISFEGKCTELFKAEEYSVSGTFETEALKLLN